MLERNLSNQVIHCFFKVYNTLGYGFLEKVYENALYLELLNNGISCRKQCPIKVLYNEAIVGEYFADIIVEDVIIIELKAAESLVIEHEYQIRGHSLHSRHSRSIIMEFGILLPSTTHLNPYD